MGFPSITPIWWRCHVQDSNNILSCVFPAPIQSLGTFWSAKLLIVNGSRIRQDEQDYFCQVKSHCTRTSVLALLCLTCQWRPVSLFVTRQWRPIHYQPLEQRVVITGLQKVFVVWRRKWTALNNITSEVCFGLRINCFHLSKNVSLKKKYCLKTP